MTDFYTVKDLGYDPDRDFDLVSMIYEEGSLAVSVHPSIPAKKLDELFALAKKEPGKLSYDTTSVNFIILFGRWMNKLAGTDMLGVSYKSPAQQFQDVLSGRIQMIISSPPTVETLGNCARSPSTAPSAIRDGRTSPPLPIRFRDSWRQARVIRPLHSDTSIRRACQNRLSGGAFCPMYFPWSTSCHMIHSDCQLSPRSACSPHQLHKPRATRSNPCDWWCPSRPAAPPIWWPAPSHRR